MSQEAVESWNEIWAEADHASAQHDKALEEIAGEITPGRALEFGCGVGGNALWLAEHGWQVTAVDFSDVAIKKADELAAARGVDVELIVADATTFRSGGPYDLVLSFYIQLPPEQRAGMLSNSAGLLAPGGMVLFVGHDKTAPPSGWDEDDLESLTTVEEVEAELPGLEIVQASLIEDDGAHMSHMPDLDEDDGHEQSESHEDAGHEEHAHGASTLVVARRPH